MVTAILLSGGVGTRINSDIPKQYIEVHGKPIISYSIETFSKSEKIDGIVIVADPVWQGDIRRWLNDADVNDKFRAFAEPGFNRQLSIYNGLKVAASFSYQKDYVFIHDAARPCIKEADIDSLIEGIRYHDGVIPVLPMKDTVYLSSNGKTITSLLERSNVYAGQAPEMFVLDKYIKANECLIGDKEEDSKIMRINGSTEPAIMAGMDIAMIPGNEGNYKITTQADLDRFVLDAINFNDK